MSEAPPAPALPDVLAELNAIADTLDQSVSMGGAHTYRLAIRLRAVAAQIASREVHPAFVVEVQGHRDAAYQGGWNDGYAEGFAKAKSGNEQRERHVAETVREAAAHVADLYAGGGARAIAANIRALDLAPILAAEESREPFPTHQPPKEHT